MSNSQFIVRDTDRGNERPVESRAKAEEVKADLEELGATVEIVPPKGTDGGTTVVEHTDDESPTDEIEADTDGYDLPESGPSVDEDPLVWMPDEFTDTIDDSIAINRKGFEVLAHHYDIQCTTELVDADWAGKRVVVSATAVDADGDTYSAFGSASEQRGDDAGLLIEMADTRAYKRAISRATGVGMVAVEELQNEL